VDDADLTLVILGAVIVLFVWNRLSVGVVAILTMLALWATGAAARRRGPRGLR